MAGQVDLATAGAHIVLFLKSSRVPYHWVLKIFPQLHLAETVTVTAAVLERPRARGKGACERSLYSSLQARFGEEAGRLCIAKQSGSQAWEPRGMAQSCTATQREPRHHPAQPPVTIG